VNEADRTISPERVQANGQLIIAAPDLLAACNAAYAMMCGDDENDLEPWTATVKLLEAAIAKATAK
jgi:hypothetical protein